MSDGLSPRPIRPEDEVPAEDPVLDEDGLPPNPASLRSPSGELRCRPRMRSWAGDAASLERAHAEFDAEDKTPERERLRSVRRAAVAARKATSVELCRKFSRGEVCEMTACPLRHETDSSMEARQIERATSQRIASETAKAADLGRRSVPAVKYVTDDPAANAALAAQRAVEAGGHGAGRSRADLQARLGHAHWCDLCSVSNRAAKQHAEHLGGKKHAQALETSQHILREYRGSAWCDAAVPLVAVTSAWTLSAFLDGLPRRSRTHARVALTLSMGSDEAADERGAGCMETQMTLSGLSADKRGQLWRYLRDLIPHHPELPEVVADLEQSAPRFCRLKEILESTEVNPEPDANPGPG